MGREEQGVSGGVARYTAVPRTLCFVEREGSAGPEVLLLRGAPHKRIWPNRYNGIGGHVERGEDIHSAALREIREEAGIEVRDLRLRAILHVDAGSPHPGVLVFVFTACHAAGDPKPTSEGTAHWVRRDQVLSLDLVEDLRELLPRLWAQPPEAPPFFGRYYYDEDNRWMMEWTMPA